MKTLVTILLILASLVLRGQENPPLWGQQRLREIEKEYEVDQYIHPYFLQADFSGDQKDDLAVLIQNKMEKKKGMVIIFAESNKHFILGAGKKFSNGGDNFSWADQWEIFNRKITYETTFKEDGDVDGAKEVRLYRSAIEIRESEGSGGLIYFNGTEFVWIHQGD